MTYLVLEDQKRMVLRPLKIRNKEIENLNFLVKKELAYMSK